MKLRYKIAIAFIACVFIIETWFPNEYLNILVGVAWFASFGILGFALCMRIIR